MSTHVFLGPTLSAERARAHLDAEYHPPAEQGDVLRAIDRGATAIGIVDGFFQFVPSIWHKEVLLALERGVRVYGAASMGALRAAELHPFGMVGVGRVYEWYASGLIEDDDEVAVAHAPAEFGYRAISDAMVNIRDALARAVDEAVVPPSLAQRLVDRAKSLHYPDRSFADLLRVAPELGADPSQVRRLESFLARQGASLKERDARAMLDAMASDAAAAAADGAGAGAVHPPPGWRVERTVFLADLLSAVDVEAGDAEHPVGETSDVARKKTLLRILARREASRAGVELGAEDVQRAADAFRAAFHLDDEETTLEWLRTAGLTREAFADLMRDAALIEALQEHLAAEVDLGAVEQARLATARLWARYGV
ncbi:hypothetical protein GCM10023168_13820 [Fodinibacter luteus]|uniref:TfuA-like core domain-containing protein n=1 Tax=Fodinibacter luteus TaxID=552064 RepID=A0ABP8KA69_9MICO